MYISVGRTMQNPGLGFRREESQGFCPECGPLGGNFKLIFFKKTMTPELYLLLWLGAHTPSILG